MLVLTRKLGEVIDIGDDIHVRVVFIRGGTVQLAISAPDDVTILRDELLRHEAGVSPTKESTHAQ